MLARWRTDTDEFIEGQWFKGRIYERRADLSPSGELLIYFAAKFKESYAWTAISHPPYLSALALWHKQDTWGGGGLFATERVVELNHREEERVLAEGFSLPKSIKIKPCGEYPGRGEDFPIMDYRMLRDGWELITRGEWFENKFGARIWIEYKVPMTWKKANQKIPKYDLIYQLVGVHERDGASYLTDHMVRDNNTGAELTLGRTDWADWCRRGDLLYAKDGKLYRLPFENQDVLPSLESSQLLYDFTTSEFIARKSPDEANSWD